MATRRRFIQAATLMAGGLLLQPNKVFSMIDQDDKQRWMMPDESAPHRRTWMAFGASKAIWGGRLLPEVQRNLATIALAIADYEPVTMLVREDDYQIAYQLIGSAVELLICPLDDLWLRDTGPVFVHNAQGKKAGIDFNFNGCGNKQLHRQDAHVASFVTEQAGVERMTTNLVLEGGGIEVDGEGTAIITESCVLNQNRNPSLSKADCETELKRLLGLEKIIWLPGIKGKDITDGHTDFYARFTTPGTVVAGYDPDPQSFDHEVTKKHLAILRNARDAKGRKLNVVVLENPSDSRGEYANHDFAAGYINFYVCNNAVIAPEFGDKITDTAAKAQLKHLYPNRDIVMINIDGIAAGGGGIHCTTQQEPL
ncbi:MULTISPECIES: agmatine/peptidylarginine deiminase [Yersinia]|uniref:agmatine deiminase family protein n=1 Tax=Yersinia TaxID=629 RepID=UPI000EB580C9|nr:agmatine deiminase family protein [Yersinia sp. IP36721]